MSVVFLRSNGIRRLVAAVCLFSLTAAAQQANTGASTQKPQSQTQAPAAQQNTQQSAAPDTSSIPTAPESHLPQPFGVDYSKPAPFLPNPFARYIPRDVPPPSFTNAPKLRELIKNGKVMLSLNDAISVALADNLDIAIARYNLPIADTDIMLTKAGGSPRGVNAGVVSNTPGGGVGGIGSGVTGAGAGGTTAGAGGAGAGAGGIVGSTSGAGPQPDNFDPVLSANFQITHSTSPQASPVLAGTTNFQQNQGVANFSYTQGFSPGTLFNFTFDNNRATSNSIRSITNPTLNSSFTAQVRQHLLQGFGPSLNTRLIRQAKNNKNISEEGFRQQVISTVSQIENIYWDLVNAYEDVRVKERSLGLAQKTLSDNQKQVQIGTLAPLDVVRAQSSVSAAEQDLIVSKTTLQLQQLIMKNALTRNLPTNAEVMQMDVVPTDTVQVPEQENLPAVDELIKMALDNRPDYKQQLITLKNAEINIQGAKNGLLPALDIVGFYGATSLAGVQNSLATCGQGQTPAGTGCIPAGTVPTTGFGDAFTNLFNSTGPNKGVFVNLQIPLGNRAAQATQVRSMLEFRQSQLGLKSLENQIAIAVRNDQFTVEQNRARVVAARQARELAAQTLDAEQKKYNLGASTYLAVLQDERDLAQAESNLLSSMTLYAKSRVQLDKDTAQTLDRNNIKIDEAVTGSVRTQPAVPGTVSNPNAIQDVNNPSGQQPKPPLQK
ncbi:MAG TPA: TolC family protein [Candidatus Angelobacter sp.]|jgi:outer membrane protein|nr:TolC family protein [Candidatus Angelobacter sp.]